MTETTTLMMLRQLYTVNQESVEGLRDAAEHAQTEGIDTMLKAVAQKRSEYAARMADVIRRMGGDPEELLLTDIAAELHQLWVDIRAAFSDDDVALLKSVRNGEQQALTAYETVLKQDELPEHVKEMLNSQHLVIQQDIERLDEILDHATA